MSTFTGAAAASAALPVAASKFSRYEQPLMVLAKSIMPALVLLRVCRHAIVGAGLVLLTHIGAANAFSWDDDKEERALQRIVQFQARNELPSIAASVSINGKVLLTRAVTSRGSAVPNRKKTRYHIGSLTKHFIAAAILALIEDETVVPSTGLPFTLDTIIRELEPAVGTANPVGDITIRRLLTMTANLPNYTDDEFLYTPGAGGSAPVAESVDVADIIERPKTYGLTEPPGKYEYSNTNYFILALAIQVLKGRGPTNTPVAHTYLRERILARAGMSTVGFDREPTPSGVVDARPGYLRTPAFDHGDWLLGAGDMISSVEDVARWHNALMGGRVIKPSSVEIMFTPAAPPVVTNSQVYLGCRYAMGWYACERPDGWLYQQDGVVSGFMASNAIARKNDGSWSAVTVLANKDATVEIVHLVRDVVEIVRSSSVPGAVLRSSHRCYRTC